MGLMERLQQRLTKKVNSNTIELTMHTSCYFVKTYSLLLGLGLLFQHYQRFMCTLVPMKKILMSLQQSFNLRELLNMPMPILVNSCKTMYCFPISFSLSWLALFSFFTENIFIPSFDVTFPFYPSLDSSIGSPSVRYSGGPRFKSRQGSEFFKENK